MGGGRDPLWWFHDVIWLRQSVFWIQEGSSAALEISGSVSVLGREDVRDGNSSGRLSQARTNARLRVSEVVGDGN